MAKCTPLCSVLLAAPLFLCIQALATADIPSDQLMSASTRGFISIADFAELSENWSRTQFGQLMQDEAMQPFVQDLRMQVQKKLAGVRDSLGVEFADLKGVASGEIGVGLVERQSARAVVALTADVSGRIEEAQELLRKVDRELISRKATKSTVQSGDAEMTVYAIPPQAEGDIAREAVFFIHQDVLCGCDSRAEAEEMLQRFGANSGDSLADAKAYRATMQRCTAEAGDLEPEVRWFVNPFGYARASRTLLEDPAGRRGKDYVEVFRSQGFDAIRGIGGFVNFAVYGSFELLHRTSIYAPPIPGEEEKYRLAMRMMQFPNGGQLTPQEWAPRGLASYRTFNMDLQSAFEHFSTLFDAIVGQPNAFADVLEGLERDPYGPQVKFRDEFVRRLGERVTLITDYVMPITPKSERFMFIVEVKDQAAIQRAVEKFMLADPNAHRRQFEGKVIWEIAQEEHDVPELEIAIEFDPLHERPRADDALLGGNGLTSSAVCVTDGQLMIASHLEYLQQILSEKPGESLADAGDYREVDVVMQQLISGPLCARCFVRTDEAYRPTYELLRQGKMPESETLFGRLLNRLLTPPEDEDEGILRKQKIDGRQLPSFEMVRRYFSPAGTYVRSEDDGWFVVGATLTKQTAPQASSANDSDDPATTVR